MQAARCKMAVICVLGLAWTSHVKADSPDDIVELRGHVRSLVDSQGSLSPNMAWRKFKSGAGELLSSANPDFGFTADTVWVLVDTASLRLDDSTEWVLEVGFPRLRDVQFFTLSQSGKILSQAHLTVNTPLAERPIYSRAYQFPFRHSGLVDSVLVRVQSSVRMQVPLVLRSRTAASGAGLREELTWGIYFGLAFIMVIYNLGIYFFNRESIHLLYSALVLSFVFLNFVSRGFGYYFFPDSWSPFYEHGVLLGALCPAVLFCAFLVQYFQLQTRDLASYRLIVGMVILLCLHGAYYPWNSATGRSQVAFVIAIFVVVVLLGVTARRIFAGQAGAKFLMVAWVALLGGHGAVFLKSPGRASPIVDHTKRDVHRLGGGDCDLVSGVALPHA